MTLKDRQNRLQGSLLGIPVLICATLVLASQYPLTNFLLIFGGGMIGGLLLSYWWTKTYKAQLQSGTLPRSTKQSIFIPIIIALFIVLGVPGVRLLAESVQTILAIFSIGVIFPLVITATIVVYRTK
jgi:hypothetical protein